MIGWLRRRIVTGFFVLVPLVVSLIALVWVFRVVDGFTAPFYARFFGDRVPPGLLRLSVGLEDPETLWSDLRQALRE